MREVEAAAGRMAELAPVPQSRRIRTLVVSRDLAYRERAMTVLGDLGPVAFAVAALADPDDAIALLRDERADVIVLDATDCERAAAVIVSRLAEVAPRAGVVVVCHHCTDAARALNALPKWGWRQDLRAAVELAAHHGNSLRPALFPARRRGVFNRHAGPLEHR
jgi:hypothetical protein